MKSLMSIFAVFLTVIALFASSCAKKPDDSLNKERFMSEVQETIYSRYPEVEAVPEGKKSALLLLVKSKNESIGLDIADIYDKCLKEPQNKNKIVDSYLAEKLAPLKLVNARTIEELKDKILPRVVSKKWLYGLNKRQSYPEEQMPFTNPLLADIVESYVIDYPDSVEYISRKTVEQWKISAGALHDTALENLRRKTRDIEPSCMKTPKGKILIYNCKDGYDSARILLARELCNGEKDIIAGIPDRDYLILILGKDEKMIAATRGMVKEEFAKNSCPVSTDLFAIDGDKLRSMR